MAPGLLTTLVGQNYVDLPGGDKIMDQVLGGKTIQAFQKTYSELVDKAHETELKFIKEQVKCTDVTVYTSNPVRELHTFYKLKTYFCHYFLFCKELAAKTQAEFTAEFCKNIDTWSEYVLALKNWACLRSTNEKEKIFAAAVIKATRAMYQV